VADAISRSEVIVFAIPLSAMPAVIDANAEGLADRILIDATNDFDGPSLSHVDSLLARASRAKVFRAFKSLGWESFANPTYGSAVADLFYCGPDSTEAQRAFEGLVHDVGLRPIRVGDLDQVSTVDWVVKLWFTLAVSRGPGRHIAFKLLSD
jgi:predicted dinucleotide-binding enzyme